MSDYTHLNLKDADDQAPNFGLSPDLEFRMARVPLGLEHSGISYCRVSPGFRLPFGHKHKNQEEIYVLVTGGARMKIEDEVRDLKPWDAVRVHKDTMRSIEAGDEGAVFLIVGAPNTGPGDAEMVQEWWSDERTDRALPRHGSRRERRARGGRCRYAGPRGGVRDAAPRVLPGDDSRPGARVYGGGSRSARLLRDEGVPQRRTAPAPRRRGSRRRRLHAR